MARTEYEGVPQVEARTQAPDDYINVSTSPDAFGGALARGGEALGAGIGQLSAFYGKAAADDATNNTLQQVTNILRGDPHKTTIGPDGQPVPDTGYFGLQGANAMRAREDTANAIDAVIRQQRNGLTTPQAQLEYDMETRRWRAQWTAQMGEHADNSQRTWMHDTNLTSYTLALNEAATNPNDPGAVALAQDKARGALVRNAQLLGEDPTGAQLKADQGIAAARIRSLTQTDSIAAVKLSRDSRGLLAGTPEGYTLNREATAAAALQLQGTYGNPNNMAAFGFGEGGAALAGAVSPGSDALHHAFWGQESGNSDTVHDSSAGAKGPGQIEPATFARWAKLGESITNPADNRAVSARILDHYAQQYNGDPARVAVAYFSGPGNVAPEGSAHPWKHDYADSDGTHVSKYVAGITKRLGGAQAGGGDPSTVGVDTESRYLDFVRGKAAEVFPEEPGVVEHIVRGVQGDLQSNFAIGAATARTGVDSKLQNAAAEVDRAQVVTGALPTDAEIRTAYPRDPERQQVAMQNRDDIAQVSALLTGMADKTPAQIQQLRESIEPDKDHPETYAQRARIAGHVEAALNARAKAIVDDPGNYIVMTHPDVAALGAKVWGAGGHIEDYGALDDAVRSHLTAIGVADQDISILPKAIATAMVRHLEQNPTTAYDQIVGMENKLGPRFQQLFQDLVKRGGLSPDYQMVAEVGPVNGGLLARAYGEPGKNNGKKIDDSLAASIPTSVRKFVDANLKLKQVADSLTASSGSKAMRDSMYNAVQTLTFARMVYKGEDQATAQDAAVQAFTSQWDIMPNGGARVPHSRFADVNYNAQYTVQSWVSKANVRDGLGRPVTDDYVRLLKASPSWITSPNADALWLVDPQGKVVRQAKDGQPVSVNFKHQRVVPPTRPPLLPNVGAMVPMG